MLKIFVKFSTEKNAQFADVLVNFISILQESIRVNPSANLAPNPIYKRLYCVTVRPSTLRIEFVYRLKIKIMQKYIRHRRKNLYVAFSTFQQLYSARSTIQQT